MVNQMLCAGNGFVSGNNGFVSHGRKKGGIGWANFEAGLAVTKLTPRSSNNSQLLNEPFLGKSNQSGLV